MFADFCPFVAILTLFWCIFILHCGAFLAIFPIFLGFVGISWGTVTIYFTDFGAIMAIFEDAPLGAVGSTAPEPPAEFGARSTPAKPQPSL